MVIEDRKVRQFKCVGYSCVVWAYNRTTQCSKKLEVIIAAPGNTGIRRVLNEELGLDWDLMTWNAGSLAQEGAK